MNYPEDVMLNELMWEYDYTKTQAEAIIKYYKSTDRYSDLCDLIQQRSSLKLSKEMLMYVQ